MESNNLMNIDDIIEIFKEFEIQKIDGNIIFPSKPIDIPLERYVQKLGVEWVRSSYDRSSSIEIPNIYQVPGMKQGDCFLRCSTLKSFQDTIYNFREHVQSLPYSIQAHYGTSALLFGANKKERHRVKLYRSLISDLDKLRAEKAQTVKNS